LWSVEPGSRRNVLEESFREIRETLQLLGVKSQHHRALDELRSHRRRLKALRPSIAQSSGARDEPPSLKLVDDLGDAGPGDADVARQLRRRYSGLLVHEAQHCVFVSAQAERAADSALESVREDCGSPGHPVAEHRYSAAGFSTSRAIPWPPPTQADAMPYRAPISCS
jgi:hypothetical protein